MRPAHRDASLHATEHHAYTNNLRTSTLANTELLFLNVTFFLNKQFLQIEYMKNNFCNKLSNAHWGTPQYPSTLQRSNCD
jgi:hypothetical protein